MVISCAPRRCSALFLPPGARSLQTKNRQRNRGNESPTALSLPPAHTIHLKGDTCQYEKGSYILPSSVKNPKFSRRSDPSAKTPAGNTCYFVKNLLHCSRISGSGKSIPVRGIACVQVHLYDYPCGTRGSRVYIKNNLRIPVCCLRAAAPSTQVIFISAEAFRLYL